MQILIALANDKLKNIEHINVAGMWNYEYKQQSSW